MHHGQWHCQWQAGANSAPSGASISIRTGATPSFTAPPDEMARPLTCGVWRERACRLACELSFSFFGTLESQVLSAVMRDLQCAYLCCVCDSSTERAFTPVYTINACYPSGAARQRYALELVNRAMVGDAGSGGCQGCFRENTPFAIGAAGGGSFSRKHAVLAAVRFT